MESLVNSRDLMKLLNLKAGTFYNLKKNKKLPVAVRIGRTYKWRIEDINTWIENNKEAI